MIKLIRIDDRLIHGQVAVAWTKDLKINCIVIANDSIVNDSFRKMTLNLAKPMDVELKIFTVNEAIDFLNSDAAAKFKILVLIDTSDDALRLTKGLKEVSSLNIGGMRMKTGKKMISSAVAVDSQDIENLDEIISNGIEVEVRQVPTKKKVLFRSLIRT